MFVELNEHSLQSKYFEVGRHKIGNEKEFFHSAVQFDSTLLDLSSLVEWQNWPNWSLKFYSYLSIIIIIFIILVVPFVILLFLLLVLVGTSTGTTNNYFN